MRKIIVLLAMALLMTCFLSLAYGQSKIRVAVTPFECERGLERYGAYCRDELENLIVNFGTAEIVERARMDQMAKELAFGSFSGMTDTSQVAKFGKMVGANILVTGSLLKVDTEQKGFGGFGIATKKSQTVATIRIRAYNVEKGTIIYSQTVKGSTESFGVGVRGSSGGGQSADERSVAIEGAMKNLAQDDQFKNMFAKVISGESQTAKRIKIEVVPTPDNCDIEVNGVYQGSTPASINFTPGVTVTIKLTKAGYLPWEKNVAVMPGMRISPELEKKPPN